MLLSVVFVISSCWRHQMETFSALLAICAGNSSVTGEFPAQRQVTLSLDVFFDLCLNKRLSKQSWGWWFETLSRPLWRHRNVESYSYGLTNFVKLKLNPKTFTDWRRSLVHKTLGMNWLLHNILQHFTTPWPDPCIKIRSETNLLHSVYANSYKYTYQNYWLICNNT